MLNLKTGNRCLIRKWPEMHTSQDRKIQTEREREGDRHACAVEFRGKEITYFLYTVHSTLVRVPSDRQSSVQSQKKKLDIWLRDGRASVNNCKHLILFMALSFMETWKHTPPAQIAWQFSAYFICQVPIKSKSSMGEMSSVPSSLPSSPLRCLICMRYVMKSPKKKHERNLFLWATTRVAVLAEMSHQLKKAGLGDTARAC